MKTEDFLLLIKYNIDTYYSKLLKPTHVTVSDNWENPFKEYLGEKQDEYFVAGLRICFSADAKEEEIIVGFNQYA